MRYVRNLFFFFFMWYKHSYLIMNETKFSFYKYSLIFAKSATMRHIFLFFSTNHLTDNTSPIRQFCALTR
uniref:Putative secreted protein n=1 Tax=Ixodes ricinus TaxID=34613 RepID=A0A147BBE4_IXORI